jgi:hypothetical protein
MASLEREPHGRPTAGLALIAANTSNPAGHLNRLAIDQLRRAGHGSGSITDAKSLSHFAPGVRWNGNNSLAFPDLDRARITAYPSTTSPDSVFGGVELRSREKSNRRMADRPGVSVTTVLSRLTHPGQEAGRWGFPTHRCRDTAISIPRLDASAARLFRECGVRVHTGLPVETAARTTQPIADPSIPFPIASEESVRGERSHRLG